MFDIEEYNYSLPPRLIAQAPVSRRDASRLLVVDREKEAFSDSRFSNLPTLLRAGDLLVVNDTRVVPARLFGKKESGGRVEILVLEHPVDRSRHPDTRVCLFRSSKRPRVGGRLFFESGVMGLITDVLVDGRVKILFNGEQSIDRMLEEKGQMPLPPYIKRGHEDGRSRLDRERYQTIFSQNKGAVAAPTAGLHFSGELVERLRENGISVVPVTLHVGHGTFRPVRTRDIRQHDLGQESFRIGRRTAEAINRARQNRDRVIAVGTTVVRTLETAVDDGGVILPGEGSTGLFVTPGFSFRVVNAMITNFHLPKSSLLFLVSAFAGKELIMKAYEWAVEKEYRFYSYGDAMLIE